MKVYYLQNDINGDIFYVGLTTNTLASRKYWHIYDSNKTKKTYVHRYINKHCKNNFSINLLEEYNNMDDMIAGEIFYIEYFKYLGFNLKNLTSGGLGVSTIYKRVLTEEHKLKISISNKGKTMSTEAKNRISKTLTGRIRSVQERENISKGHMGQVAWNKGKALTEEHKEKVRQGLLGYVPSEEARRNMKEGQKNRRLREKLQNKK